MKIKRYITKLSLLFFLIICIGTIGYIIIEGYSFSDALFMTIITISTVGYGTKNLSEGGIAFTIILIISSLVLVALIVQNFSRYISDGEFNQRIKIRKIKRMIDKLENHVIVCGYGLNGSHATQELISQGEKVVVIDQKGNITDDAVLRGIDAVFINGDARNEEILIEAGIKKAKALISALHNDADNLFVVLSAKELNSNLKIVSRGIEDSSERKLLRAGANHVILPDSVGGIRMAKLISEPGVIEFLENILVKSGISVNLVEIDIECIKRSFIGRTISELDIRRRSGANIIGIKKGDGTYIFNPPSNTKIEEGVKLFVLGTPNQVNYFKEIVEDSEKN